MNAVIEIQDLTKFYDSRGVSGIRGLEKDKSSKRSHLALDNLNLSVEQGEIFGFVGPNGAGKTTTIRIIAGLLRPSSGDVKIDGHSVTKSPEKIKSFIGYMPDYFGIYPDLRAWEYLDFFAACYEIPEIERSRLIDGLLELVDLDHRKFDPVDKLSKGMQQRLSLARVLIHDPQILILDEPASGLDPRARIEIREQLVELAKMGKTIFFSSHILADVAEICSRVGIIEAGRLVAVGDLEQLQLQIVPIRKYTVTVLGKLEEALAVLRAYPGVTSVDQVQSNSKPNARIALDIRISGDDQALSTLLGDLVNANIPVLHFSEDSRDLEEVFMRATKGLVT